MATGNPIIDSIELMRKYGIEHVVIGGSAAILHGSAFTTQDVDFCCRWNEANLQRLADAFNSVNAKLRVQGVDEGLPMKFDVKTLKQYVSVALIADAGFMDVRKYVDGIGDYDAVLALSQIERFEDYEIRLLGLDGLIQSKTFLNRPRDRAILPELELIREEHAKRQDLVQEESKPQGHSRNHDGLDLGR